MMDDLSPGFICMFLGISQQGVVKTLKAGPRRQAGIQGACEAEAECSGVQRFTQQPGGEGFPISL